MTDDDTRDTRPRQLVHAARERMQQARNQVWADRTDGGVGRSTRRQFIVAMLAYRDVLEDYRGDDALQSGDKEGWEDYNVDWPLDWLHQRVTVEEPTKGPRGGGESQLEPAILHADIGQLLDVSKGLDEIAMNLGFGASTKDVTPSTRAEKEDLVALLQARGQEQALENLPARFESES